MLRSLVYGNGHFVCNDNCDNKLAEENKTKQKFNSASAFKPMKE